ncbi:transcription initiation factor TFIID component TAF4 family-domain-containing protein [Calycina marina]|uniref:Transcription initiation factor TFIID subunit 4 n=1 Tax=Calycina marina TaxID=1763456 RepID=A0A9P7Z0F0_9HELO|nr:transcription initiation factor TFIID component TAF4 family-domain-containing protein [Calycina marina]
MAQQTPQFPVQTAQQTYSPQGTHSPLYPSVKRQQLSPNTQQQQLDITHQNMSQQNRQQSVPPYNGQTPLQAPYAGSPGAVSHSSNNANFQNAQSPQTYGTSPYSNTPYPQNGNVNGNGNSNGNTTPSTLMQPPYMQQNDHIQHNGFNQPMPRSPLGFPGQQMGMQQSYNGMAPPGAGTMGPPLKPIEKPKEDGIDPMDVLGGTGIDLREEEQYQFQRYKDSFDTQQTGSYAGYIIPNHSFSQFPPGDASSFYGAGPANARGQPIFALSQEETEKNSAEKAWNDSATALATSRKNEIANPFLNTPNLQVLFQKHAHKTNLALNNDKSNSMGAFLVPANYPSPQVNVTTTMGPTGGIITTNGVFVPNDSLLCDSIALLSIATKQRIRSLLEDALKLSKARQTGSHGIVPEAWADAAAELPIEAPSIAEDAIRSGWESAVSPGTNPRKRSHDAAMGDRPEKLPTPVSEISQAPAQALKFKNAVSFALRNAAQKERDLEELRIKKRNERNSGASGDVSRQGSIAPGTPGTTAPEASEKSTSKKETKKKDKEKTSDTVNHANANATSTFLVGKANIFGKKKTYSWMTGGGSGASTPGKTNANNTLGNPSLAAPEKLTMDGVRRLGQWREDKEKGKGIQIRDWMYVLEKDGREAMALQKIYADLDASGPK